MRILYWNIKGLGNPEKRESVENFISLHCFDVVCLQESRVSSPLQFLLRSCGGNRISKWAMSDAKGASGGVFVRWNEYVFSCVEEWIGSFFVSVVLSDVGSDLKWRLTTVYGPNNRPKIQEFWDVLSSLKQSFQLTWVICGDFNATRFLWERSSGIGDRKYYILFSDFVQDS